MRIQGNVLWSELFGLGRAIEMLPPGELDDQVGMSEFRSEFRLELTRRGLKSVEVLRASSHPEA